jgi:two-component system chemotaxis response regulator CheY
MKTCLIVDDSSVIRKVARRILEGLDFQITEAEDGEEAIGRPKVVFCTTENDVAHIARALHAGANEYIMKPFDKEIVEAKFQEVGLL